MRIIYSLLIVLISLTVNAQVDLYPSHWWVGMHYNKVQLLVKGPDPTFNQSRVVITYPGVKLETVTPLENGKYYAIDLIIDPTAKPGLVPMEFRKGKKSIKVNWPIKQRSTSTFAQGVTSSDLIYLIMPDRFCNGDPTNDRIKGMRDQSLNRDSIFHRHGGDLQGIINHLDYLKELGVTTLWMMPVIENDMPNRSEHGYAFTNHYKIEPRFGGDAMYRKLSDELHKRGMKLIQDAVYNHVGLYHFFVQEKPTKDWLHEWPTYTNTTYKEQPLFDPYSAATDRARLSDGWFTPMMPDLNHSNPYVANFLIQHAIWSVEEFGVDGWRIDTYIYNDLQFMNRCNQALVDEYPNISLFGETWVHGMINQAYYAKNNLNVPFKSNLPGVTDFQLNLYGIEHALNEPFGWTNGVNRLYTSLASDIVYEDPMKNVLFLDNHDKSRFFSVVGEDIAKQKMGIAWLMTCRGIPQLYYGTEIIMKNFSNPDGLVRLDFPGGWPGDKSNKFTAAGRTAQENEVFEYTKTLANFRLSSSAIKTGKFTQYVPEDGVYVYFRYDDKQTVMCVMNPENKDMTIDLSRFAERLKGFSTGREVTTDAIHSLNTKLNIKAKTLMVLELK
jgi:neopullulanase